MKLKKALSGILAAAMVVTLTPAMAFASTVNSVVETQKVATDDSFTTELNLKVDSIDSVGGIFDVTLNNAEWDVDGDPAIAKIVDPNATAAGDLSAAAGEAIAVTNNVADPAAFAAWGSGKIQALDVSENSVRIETNTTTVPKDSYIKLIMKLKAGSESGDITVSISNVSAKVSSGTYTVATIAGADTVASVIGSSIKNVSADGVYPANQIKISETSANSVKNTGTADYQAVKFMLPKDYTWDMTNTTIGGDMPVKTALTAMTSAIQATIGTAAFKTTLTGTNSVYELTNDDRGLVIYFAANGAAHEEIFTISPSIKVDTDASTGEVAVSITNLKGDIAEADGLVIAKNVVESVEVKPLEKITTIQSGLKNKNGSDSPHYVYVTLKENTVDAITAGKTVTFDFDESVQVVGAVTVSTESNPTKDSTYSGTLPAAYGASVAVATTNKTTTSKDASEFKWTSQVPTTDVKQTLTFKVPVSVEAGFTGDVDVTVSGAKAGIEETTVTVGTVVAPVVVEATAAQLKTGITNQPLGDIVIKETEKGMLQDLNAVDVSNYDVDLFLSNYDVSGLSLSSAKATIKVTEGDIEVENFETKNGHIYFNIKSESTKASTIVISGLTANLTRYGAEGMYNLRVGGNAVAQNGENGTNGYNNDSFAKYTVQSDGYIEIITPADSTTVSEKVDAKFVIGEASYTNNGVATEMDAAAYIDKNNRTMVPIRYVANACGISENDIRWEQNTQTAIINGLNTVVTVKMGSNKLQTSTGEITMDTVAVNNNGRIYVPVRYIANALGANVSWDAATKTVTLTK